MYCSIRLFITLGSALVVASWKCLPRLLPPHDTHDVIRIPECMLNVRTVIFSQLDTNKPCWSMSEVELLVARRVMQTLVPTTIPRNFKMLYRFFERSEHTLRSKLAGPRKVRLFFMAFYDVVGGYIHSIVIPVLNEAYYAGNVDYETVKNFHGLLGRIMGFLDTNGDGWAGPCDMAKIPTRVIPLPLHICRAEESCKAFVVTDDTMRKTPKEPCKKGPPRNNDLSRFSNKFWNYCSKGFSKIPLPFLDDSGYPSAIAVPLKDRALFSLMSEKSVNVLPKYYILAMRCLSSSDYSYNDIVRFNYFFHKWLMKDVVPHLYDLQRWYPGFGGVMRIIETMNQRGLASNEHLPTTNRTPHCNRTYVRLKSSKGFNDNFAIYTAAGLAIIAGTILFIWLVVNTTKMAKKSFNKKKNTYEETDDEEENDEDADAIVNTLVASLCQQRGGPLTFPGKRSYSSMSVSRRNDRTQSGT